MNAAFYLLGGNNESIRHNLTQATGHAPPSWYFPAVGFLSLLYFVSLIGVWTWKRWGVYDFYGVLVLSLILSIAAGYLNAVTLFSLVIPLILFFLIRPHWEDFE
jgi:hypothetical protein